MKGARKTLAACITLAVVAMVLAQAHVVSAESYDEDIDDIVPAQGYLYFSMDLDEGQEVSVDLTVTSGGDVDFWFLDSVQYALFVSWASTGLGTFIGISALSEQDASAIDKTTTIDADGRYYFTIVNWNLSTVTVEGNISATYPLGMAGIAIVIALIVILVVIVVVVIMYRKKKAKEAAMAAPPPVGGQVYGPPPPPPPGSPPQASSPDSGRKACPSCGGMVPVDAVFCRNCGAKLN